MWFSPFFLWLLWKCSRKYNKLRLRCRQLNLNDEVSKQLNSDETSAITLDEEDTLEEAKSLGNADALAEEADTQYETKTVGKSETLEDEAKTLEADPETIEDAKTLGKAEPVEEEAETLEAKTLQLGEETSDESNTLGKGETHEEDKIVKLGETVEEVKTLEREETSDEEEQSCITGANSESSEDEGETQKKSRRATENYSTWQRIIRLDALRANADWIAYSPGQAAVSNETAAQMAAAAGLQDYSHLEPCRVLHASRLVSILEAYALLDPEIGYCQGMSDLLSPIIAVVDDDSEAFWCFAGFMRKARHNFRLDEVGIRRQLSLVAKIIKQRDGQLYRHLEKLQAEDCFFVYRMVVVLLRREMSFEQTLCLWEVMWADQAAVRAGVGKSGWDRIRQRAPPTEDLLLYAIAACVLQRRKMIIEKYSSMDEILRECNSMAGRLDFWKLLNDAHDLVVALHDKVWSPWLSLSLAISLYPSLDLRYPSLSGFLLEKLSLSLSLSLSLPICRVIRETMGRAYDLWTGSICIQLSHFFLAAWTTREIHSRRRCFLSGLAGHFPPPAQPTDTYRESTLEPKKLKKWTGKTYIRRKNLQNMV